MRNDLLDPHQMDKNSEVLILEMDAIEIHGLIMKRRAEFIEIVLAEPFGYFGIRMKSRIPPFARSLFSYTGHNGSETALLLLRNAYKLALFLSEDIENLQDKFLKLNQVLADWDKWMPPEEFIETKRSLRQALQTGWGYN